ncbi:hypothetical protein RDV78_04975 [Bacillota bacterium LX-D]|nr:hypothetical protein [Bacillota bacterium LX-D]
MSNKLSCPMDNCQFNCEGGCQKNFPELKAENSAKTKECPSCFQAK